MSRRSFGRISGSLQRKYALIFGSLVAGAVLASSAVEIYSAYASHQSALARIQEAEARGAAGRIEQFFGGLENDLASVSPAFWASGGGTLDQRMNEYTRVLRQSPAITDIAYIDGRGREQLDVSRLSINRYASGIDHTQDPVFLAARERTIAYGELYFRDGSEPYVTIARGEGTATGGAVLAEVNLKFLRDVISGIRIGQSGKAYVVDEHGTLVAHPDSSLVLRRTDLSDLLQVRSAIASTTSSMVSGEPSMVALDSTGRPVLTAYRVIRPVGWVVLAELPLDEAFAPLAESLTRVAAVLVVGLLVALMASAIVARRMVRPIRALQAGAAQIGAGVLDARIEIHSGDELENLADDINGMTVRLRDSYAALERTTAERERHEQELRIARDIQQALLPRGVPELPGWSIRAHYQPARVVGGDLYDLLALPEGKLALVVGDVAGEGVPAALLMATTRTVLHSIVANDVSSPGEVLARANEVLFDDMPHNLFVTCLFAILDPRNGKLRYANAGHVPPLRREAGTGTVVQLRARGMPLGLMPGSTYEEHDVALDFGDTLLFYSDGVVEAHDSARRMFDSDRLAAVTSESPADGSVMIQRILDSLYQFTGRNWEQEDDLTLLTLQRLEETEAICKKPRNWPSDLQVRTPALSTSVAT